jgi:hypothetical protein
MLSSWWERLSTLGLAGALAGAVLLSLGLAADLRMPERGHHALMAQLLPQCARVVAQHQAHEDANPWHRTVATGESLLVLGLGGLYWSERIRRRAGERETGRVGEDR